MKSPMEAALRQNNKDLRRSLEHEQAQNKLLTQSLDRVIASKFDRPLVMAEPVEPGSDAHRIPMTHFADVLAEDDDAAFIASVQGERTQ